MAANLNAADLPLLQEIEAVYLARAARQNRMLSAFNVQGYSGTDLLTDFVRYLKTLPPQMGDKFGCVPHCEDPPEGCPPCENGWSRPHYVRYLHALRIADVVDMTLLQQIEAQYQARAAAAPTTLIKGVLPQFNQYAPSGNAWSGWEEVFEYHQFLKSLPREFSDGFGCEPPCNDRPGGCPPCENWKKEEYKAFIERLQAQVGK